MTADRSREIFRETLTEGTTPAEGTSLSVERMRELVRDMLADRSLLVDTCRNLAYSNEFREVTIDHRDALLRLFFERLLDCM